MRLASLLLLMVTAELSAAGEPPGETGEEYVLLQEQKEASLWAPKNAFQDKELGWDLSRKLPLLVKISFPCELGANEIKEKTEPWGILSVGSVKAASSPLGVTNYQQVLTLDLLAIGEVTIHIPPLRYQLKGQETRFLEWKPITLRVNSGMAQGDKKDLRDVAPPEETRLVEPSGSWMSFLTLIFGAISLIVIFKFLRKRWKQPAKPLTPLVEAALALESLDVPLFFSSGHGALVVSLISDIVRRFLDRQYLLDSRSKTTDEFLESQKNGSPLTIEQLEIVRGILEPCDLVKFAGFPVTREDCRQLLGQAFTLIQSPTVALNVETTNSPSDPAGLSGKT